MTTPHATALSDAGQAPAAPSPHADCRADESGTLTFVLDAPGSTGAELLLRLRGSEDPAEVTLPFEPDADGRPSARLPETLALAEGRWDVFAALPGREPERLLPGLLDLRRLVDREPDATGGQVSPRIPYATKHGNLSVRSWWRAPHAEAAELVLTEGRLAVRGRLHGTLLGARAHAELCGRQAAKPVVRAELDGSGRDFTLTVPSADLTDAAGAGVWDLWLLPEGEPGPRVRVARLLDDIADRGPVFVYPGAVSGASGARARVTPYYTADNDLSVRVDIG
ncbi:hypothetical protein HUT18_04275 [Streptomyces sp. NA04227]|uniref:hypothetical protein n=1 Tax=Streptomyces sp. NA04227 TaxID=2742136 RepID=UPI00159126D5|nr:hypothetical protein [Streptomyces sp. NA04227]QKW05714.1 hypothetical protein HUT18_04275 [Streptomyces sp. NA04227]